MRRTIKTPGELGLLVRATRKATGHRLGDIATDAQLGHVFVRHVEHGKDTLQLGKVLQLLDTLGIVLEAQVPKSVQVELDKLNAKGLRPLKARAPQVPREAEPTASP